MAKNIRTSDALYALAALEAALQHRSLAQQIEYWARLGMAAERRGSTAQRMDAIEAGIETTRRLDILDVRSGRRSADYTFFIPRSLARASKPAFRDDDP
jgi:hypothetical protein